jgi:hypothetical protein
MVGVILVGLMILLMYRMNWDELRLAKCPKLQSLAQTTTFQVSAEICLTCYTQWWWHSASTLSNTQKGSKSSAFESHNIFCKMTHHQSARIWIWRPFTPAVLDTLAIHFWSNQIPILRVEVVIDPSCAGEIPIQALVQSSLFVKSCP